MVGFSTLLLLRVLATSFLLLCLFPPLSVSAFSAVGGGASTTSSSSLSSSSSSVTDLLAADQYDAQKRRAEEERQLLHPNGKLGVELQAPDFTASKGKGSNKKNDQKAARRKGGGGGFGGAGSSVAPDKRWSKNKALAEQQKQTLLENGVIRINDALTDHTCDALRDYVVERVATTAALYEEARQTGSASVDFDVNDHYGIEPGRSCRTDLLLPLTAEPVSTALEELFDVQTGKLRALYEALVSPDGIFYELACVITSKGSYRQEMHPDVPFQSPAPLYVVFAALQDVTNDMGPTTFVRGSHTEEANAAFYAKGETFDDYLRTADPVEACINKGDLIVFDARTLHCGNANFGVDRALFNFSFRSVESLAKGDLGYKGSMRPRYTRQEITLQDVMDAVDGKDDPALSLAKY
jgi:ectoine hydroxylase-related dioxygenase (phytanoyl-CoA dioxygenase family)